MALFARANANATLLTNNCYLLKLTTHDVIFRSFASYTTKFSTPRRLSKCACLVHSVSRCNVTSNSHKNFVRKCHVVPYNVNYIPYEEILTRRRQEANRSIVVQVQSSSSYEELFDYCKQFGTVKQIHHYSVKEALHFYLVEFKEVTSAEAALESATHLNFNEVIPVHSPMLWFRNAPSSTSIKATKNTHTKNQISPSTNSDCQIPSDDEITKSLVNKSISEQMILLYDAWKLDEVGIRLRFLTAHQLERSFAGLFPHIAVLPFGSSVNGFGKRGCDLDLVLTLAHNEIEKPSSRFVFHTKSISNDSRIQSRRLMEVIADSMQYFVPGVTNVRRILQARVPIIKYDQSFTGLECDLSMTNMVAVYMSEMLCLYSEVDWRVKPLVFTIRHWAKNVGLTNDSPGRWITNFSITLLVIFYLQQRGILPSLNTLKNLADTSDIRLTDHCVDCTFLRDVTKMPFVRDKANTDSLETLLQGFFEFYSIFDFPGKAISLREGASVFKPNVSPLYICNPLEPSLNVSQNVSSEETERLKSALRSSLWRLEAGDDNNCPRGILSIFEKKLSDVRYVAGRSALNFAAVFNIPKDEPKDHLIRRRSEPDKNTKKSIESQAEENRKTKKRRVRRR